MGWHFFAAHGMTARLKAKLQDFAQDTSGAVLVEFAFVLAILLLLIFGAISWSYSMSVSDAMFDAARQGARELAVGTSNTSQAEASVQSVLSIWPTSFSVTAEDSAATGSDDVRVTVTTSNVFASLVPFVPLPEQLRAEVTMRKE